ncbi:hypothetical protein PHYC_01772 [Phycisphaerales bacterium]|nr:hypothetical protein PHYC_01772 [Phycisphaerales bacterium]
MTLTICRRAHALSRAALLIAGAAGTLLAASTAGADVTYARRAKICCVVEISGKPEGTVYHIWQSTTAGGSVYEDTGHTITAGSDGSGKRTIPLNDEHTLMIGHNVKIGDANGPNDQPAHVVDRPAPMCPDSVDVGLNHVGPLVVSQAMVDNDGSLLLETWNPNSVFALMVDPAEAAWVNMGAFLQCQGDVQAQLMQVGPQAIVFRVLGDPTPESLDNILIHGVALQVLPSAAGGVGIHLGMQGSTNVFFNGQFLQNFAGQYNAEYQRLTVGSPAGCDPDVNCDGAVNGFDVEATEQAVNGDFSNFCRASADLNGDGAENGFDIETEEQRVNGEPC